MFGQVVDDSSEITLLHKSLDEHNEKLVFSADASSL